MRLPAEYGLRTAGIIDITTNSGLTAAGRRSVSVYGGSHSTFQPAAEYGGRSGNNSYYMEGDYKQNNLGIESPDGSSDPLHDHTTQGHAFGYFEHILDSENRLTLIVGLSDDQFEIPNQRGLQPTLGYSVLGQTQFLSDDLNENQHELAEYAIVSWQHSQGALDWQTSLSARYTSLHFSPDPLGDLLYNGIAQDAFKDDAALAWQTDAAYKITGTHTLRAGFFFQHDSSESRTTSGVLPLDAAGMQTSDVPLLILDNGDQSQEIESAVSAGRVEGVVVLYAQLRPEVRSLQRLFQWQPAQPACELRVATGLRHDGAWGLLTLLHATAVRAGW